MLKLILFLKNPDFTATIYIPVFRLHNIAQHIGNHKGEEYTSFKSFKKLWLVAVFEILSVILKFRNPAKMLFNLFKKFLETPGVVLSIRKLSDCTQS